MADMETKLYRHYDTDGALLYVGISLSAISRLKQHRKSAWTDRIARVEISTYPNRAAALRAEAWVIATEMPRFNQRKQGNAPMSNAQVGSALHYTLAEAYRMARKGDVLSTIDPIEFAMMSIAERRHHRRIMKALARRHRDRKSPQSESVTMFQKPNAPQSSQGASMTSNRD